MAARKKFIKYMLSPFENASRNERELSVVSGLGWDIVVCAAGSDSCEKKVDGYTVHQYARKRSKLSAVRKIQILYGWFIREPRYLRQYHADVISCHDLTALFIGWLSTWFIPRSRKPDLVYDAHEFEIGRFTEKKRNVFVQFLIVRLEKFLMGKCTFSMMVNDTIADEVQKIHRQKERPVVVRNTPTYRIVDESICRQRRKEFLRSMGIHEDTFLVMYHGSIARCRGIDELLDIISGNGDVAAVIMGNGDAAFLKHLHKKVNQLGIADRVLFHPAVNAADLWQYTGAVDAGMVTVPPASQSYYYMLPNKFFEYIQSETPVIGSNFPEIAKIVNQYDIGLLVDPENREEMTDAIKRMRSDKEMYQRFKNNLKQAKEDLCWEKERKVLEDAYSGLFPCDRVTTDITAKERYAEFCKTHPQMHVFNRPWWLDAVCGENNWEVILIEENGSIIGVMPIYRCGKNIGQPLLTQKMGPFIEYGGETNPSKKQTIDKNVMTQIILKLPPFQQFRVLFDYSVDNWLPFYWQGFSQTSRYTYVIEDISNPKAVFEKFEDSKRALIKKAQKNVQTKWGMDSKTFYTYHTESLKKQGKIISYSYDLFRKIYDNAKANDSGEIFYCVSETGEIHCMVFVVWDNTSGYLLITAFDPDFRASGASSLIIYDIIRYLSIKVKSFDFEGSMDQSISESYKRFGTIQRQYSFITKDNRSLMNKHIHAVAGLIKKTPLLSGSGRKKR